MTQAEQQEYPVEVSKATAQVPRKQPLWIPIANLVIGVAVVLGALTWSQYLDEPIAQYGYVKVMFFYVVLMIIGGGLMVSGFTTLWVRGTSR
ncbi:hypothetical protein [Corynebacterium lowii]|uniref:Uncharacterized protein n=1 Tax=Corynebacterium lowii TaxID=1544413 RepID=A0A0Q0UEF4_9CORY|nr:hypothetical protein [Corynebacterium lowii]KQB86245.1 hypothetical protein Clow_01600 [Corynebacterium lowii]MDP9852720.1 hypothetical protein [Corynebacterium lowii]